VEIIELEEIAAPQMSALFAGEHQPWGGLGEDLIWRAKDRHVGVHAPDGRLIAIAGAVIVEVEVKDAGAFPALGIGGVFVTAGERGRGLASSLVEHLLGTHAQSAVDRAMLFCLPTRLSLYRRLGFSELAGPVWADQPTGRIEMPLRTMWRGLREGAAWPRGRVDLRGLPF
jgi:GNAT superfamily N-acetyltransferase